MVHILIYVLRGQIRLPTVTFWLINIAHKNVFKSPRVPFPLTQMVMTCTPPCADFEFSSLSNGQFDEIESRLSFGEGNCLLS